MDRDLRKRLEAFVQPLYQDVDGASRYGEVERIARIARSLYPPPNASAERAFDLLLLFQGLGKWLDRVGNASRTALAVGGITENELRNVSASIRRLDQPESDAERAVAAAILIDRAGVRGLAERFAAVRREGQTMLDVVRDELANAWIPEWTPERARPWLERRMEKKRRLCIEILAELALED